MEQISEAPHKKGVLFMKLLAGIGVMFLVWESIEGINRWIEYKPPVNMEKSQEVADDLLMQELIKRFNPCRSKGRCSHTDPYNPSISQLLDLGDAIYSLHDYTPIER